jgi:preprotein translocase subunit SecF
MRPSISLGVAGVCVLLGSGATAQELTEQEALARFMDRNPRVRAVRLRSDEVAAEGRMRVLRPNPSVVYTREAAAGAHDDFVLVRQDLGLTGRRGPLGRAAQASTAAAAAGADHELNQLRAELRSAFVTLLVAQERERTYRRAIGSLEDVVRILSERERTGEGSTFDRVRAERELAETPAGARVPLAAVADITEDRGPNFISRENVQRKIVVQSNVAGRDLRGVVNEIEAAVRKAVPLPPGYRIEYGGQFESEAEASRLLAALGLAVVASILVILAYAFASWRDAALIMVNLPLALIGGIAGIFVAGGVLTVASVIGLIALFGIATRNGIMLVSHIRQLVDEEGVGDFREAVIRGSIERLSPILMTALATGLALVPVALGSGEPGSELQAPMAIVIICGLFSSTVLNMVVVPAAYWRLGRRGRLTDSPRAA